MPVAQEVSSPHLLTCVVTEDKLTLTTITLPVPLTCSFKDKYVNKVKTA